MKSKLSYLSLIFLIGLISQESNAKVYRDKPIGKFAVSFDLRDYEGTLLSLMKTEIYQAMASEATNATGSSRDFLGALERGEGVEIRLSDEVSTAHVKYKNPFDLDNPERSGRSFGLVGKNRGNYGYVADASYAHFLKTLEDLTLKEDHELELFYQVIFSILANNDSSRVDELSDEGKQVAADFVAVFVAEQYRHLINGRDPNGDADNLGEVKLGSGHNWDDAHLQVTMLAAFHGGQSTNNRYIVYEGELADRVYDQNACLYKKTDDPNRESTPKRKVQLKDYWQFTYRSECPGRSGVNITRADFQKMGSMVSQTLIQNYEDSAAQRLSKLLGRGSNKNLVKATSDYFVSNSAPEALPDGGKKLVDAIVDFLMESHYNADEITNSLLGE